MLPLLCDALQLAAEGAVAHNSLACALLAAHLAFATTARGTPALSMEPPPPVRALADRLGGVEGRQGAGAASSMQEGWAPPSWDDCLKDRCAWVGGSHRGAAPLGCWAGELSGPPALSSHAVGAQCSAARLPMQAQAAPAHLTAAQPTRPLAAGCAPAPQTAGSHCVPTTDTAPPPPLSPTGSGGNLRLGTPRTSGWGLRSTLEGAWSARVNSSPTRSTCRCGKRAAHGRSQKVVAGCGGGRGAGREGGLRGGEEEKRVVRKQERVQPRCADGGRGAACRVGPLCTLGRGVRMPGGASAAACHCGADACAGPPRPAAQRIASISATMDLMRGTDPASLQPALKLVQVPADKRLALRELGGGSRSRLPAQGTQPDWAAAARRPALHKVRLSHAHGLSFCLRA